MYEVNQLLEDRRKLTAAIEASTKRATVMFVDMAGSTEYKLSRGALEGVQKTYTFINSVVQVVAVHQRLLESLHTQCTVCKFIGDEVMIWLSGPKANEVALEIAASV